MAHAFDVLSEVPFVQLLIQNDFMQGLQLAQCEFLREQFKADVVAFQLFLERVKASGDNGIVVKGQIWHVRDVNPVRASSERSWNGRVLMQADQAVVCHREDSGLGLIPERLQPNLIFGFPHPVGITKSMKLLHVDAIEAGQLIEDALGSIIEAFILPNQITGKGVLNGHGGAIFRRRGALFDEEHFQSVVIVSENDTIDRNLQGCRIH